MLEHHVERYQLVGVSVGTFTADGNWIDRVQAGVRISGDNTPLGPEDAHILGSAGKSMTSTMAARVVAQVADSKIGGRTAHY